MSLHSQNVLDGLIAYPAAGAIAANHLVYMDTNGRVAVCAVANVAKRLGAAVHAAATQGDMVSVTQRVGVEVTLVASAACTTGSEVIIGATAGQVADGSTNSVGVCTRGGATGTYVMVRLH